MICYLDMDGVLVDFIDGMCKLHNRKNPWIDNPPKYDTKALDTEDRKSRIMDAWGLSSEEFWGKSDKSFWANLQPHPDAHRLYSLVTKHFGENNVAVLTSPTYKDDSCIPGKVAWIKKNFPKLYCNLVFTKKKHFLAAPHALLIDDLEDNVESFKKFGGHSILYPAINNLNRTKTYNDFEKEFLNVYEKL